MPKESCETCRYFKPDPALMAAKLPGRVNPIGWCGSPMAGTKIKMMVSASTWCSKHEKERENV